MTPKKISILGATGSIGTTAISLLRGKRAEFALSAITAMDNVEELIRLCLEFEPAYAAIGNPAHYEQLKQGLHGSKTYCGAGESGLLDAASVPADVTLSAIVGAAGLRPTLTALQHGKSVALANKECLVCAGDLMLAEATRYGARILPVDSEHNAIYQVFDFVRPETIEAIILTASGGPFRDFTSEQMRHVTLDQALKHPNWSMGAKITIDSATMMNKGLELIEAFYLFPIKSSQIEIVIHPQSIIHSMVRYHDGSTLAQMGQPDMTIPIAYAFSWPERMKTPAAALNLADIGALTFFAPDCERFPALRLAREALHQVGTAPIILNAANEIAVHAFLERAIGFCDIIPVVERVLQDMKQETADSLEAIEAADREARRIAASLIKR